MDLFLVVCMYVCMLLGHVVATVVTPPSCLSLINILLICCMDYTRYDVRRGDNESGGECVWASTSSGED